MEFLPKVTVCIPTYNGEKYLSKTLESVVAQTGVDLEIIIGDDLSSDSSLNIAEEFAHRHTEHQWCLLCSESRRGMAGNWNECLQAATGDFIKVIGQDDLLYAEALSSQARALAEHPTVSMVVSGCEIISGEGRRLFKRPRGWNRGIHLGSKLATSCLRKRANLIGEPVTVMARRINFIELGGFSVEHRYYIDLDMWLRILKKGDCFVIPEAQCAFRIHGRSVSSSTQKDDFDQFDKLPGACEMIGSLTYAQNRTRILRAYISTIIRSIVYQLFG
jgi:glycosyltransferase involved in cell wall biosynthesis